MVIEKLKKISAVLIGILLFSFFPIVHIQAQKGTEELIVPIVEVVDLLFNGTTPRFCNITRDFQWISRMIWALDFVSNQLLFTNFAGGSGLTNGVDVFSNGTSFLGDGEITMNHEFAHTSFDLIVLSDEAGTKNRILLARWSFNKFVPPNGIRHIDNASLQFLIQDDLTAVGLAITDFTVTIEGFRSEFIPSAVGDPLGELVIFDVINWWAFALQQNIIFIIVLLAAIIAVIKILRG